MQLKFTKWIIFSVLLALVPIFANYFLHRVTNTTVDLEKLLGHGELFLVATAMAGAAIGEIIVMKRTHGILSTCSAGGGLLIVIMASMMFAFISVALLTQSSIDDSFVVTSSIIVYVFSFITGGSSIILSEA